MKYLNGNYSVEIQDKRYKIHLTQNISLGLRKEIKRLRDQYQVINHIQTSRNQKVVKIRNQMFSKTKNQTNV